MNCAFCSFLSPMRTLLPKCTHLSLHGFALAPRVKPILCSSVNAVNFQPSRGKKKKKSSSELDATVDRSLFETAVQKLYEENIMDRSHLDNLEINEIFDQSLPRYKNVVIRLISPDLQRLEAFEKFLLKNMELLQFEVSEAYPLPHKIFQVTNINPLNEKVTETMDLEEFYRVIAFEELPAVSYPILLMLLKSTVPEGVKFKIDHFSDSLKWERFRDPLEIPEIREQYHELVAKKK